MKNVKSNSQGFTIIELLIALSILSVILVMGSMIMIQIGRWYTKGINAASLQNNTRNINGDLTSTLQFDQVVPFSCIESNIDCAANLNGDPAHPAVTTNFNGIAASAYCIGKTRYSYTLNREQGVDNGANPATGTAAGTTTNHVLWRDTMKTDATCKPVDLSNAGVPVDSDTDAAKGGYEMLGQHMRLTRFKAVPVTNPEHISEYLVDIATAFGDSDLMTPPDSSGHVNCKGDNGSQFCSVANISTTVVRRLK
jgi:prepilin-type N-terminal cleavage/methylation domain-containing protein